MNATIINIGDELLIGQVTNTNASVISRMLTSKGFDVKETFTIGDNAEEIRFYLAHCIQRSDIVIITGGLGPTKDDITKKTLCEFFGSKLYENETALNNIKVIFEKRGYELTPINRQQSWIPRCCTLLNNLLGTAPGMWFEKDGKVVISLPGVPFEMSYLMEAEVLPRLQEHFNTGYIINKNIIVQGIGESFLSDRIESWELALPKSIRLAYLPQAGMVKLRLTARGADHNRLEQEIAEAVDKLYPIAGEYIVGEDAEALPEIVAQTMTKAGKTLSCAESCTGGSIASKLTQLAGASEYFMGSVTAYSNDVKESILGVSRQTLATYGAVSEETVREMVSGVRERLATDYAVATTGIAGPGGGTTQKPVGTIWIGIASDRQVITKLLHFGDRRAQNIERTCNAVFSELIKLVRAENADSFQRQ